MATFDTGTAEWAALSGLLDHALDLEPDAQRQWLDRLPPEYTALRPRLERLLSRASDGHSSDHLDTIPKFDDSTAAVDAPTPDTIGFYRILRQLAAGGMGTVW